MKRGSGATNSLLKKHSEPSFGSPQSRKLKQPVHQPAPQPAASTDTQEYVSQLEQGASNVLVAVRTRPLSKKEKEIDSRPILEILEGKVVVLIDPVSDQAVPEEAFRINRTKERQYAFDFAFSEDTPQLEVYQNTTNFLLDGVLKGYNATVFAYGPTGAGKTYTMLGTAEKPGLMLMTIVDLFCKAEELEDSRVYKIKLSYLEIYNEVLRDLIHPSKEVMDLREDPQKGMVVAGLSEIMPTSPEEVVSAIRLGNKRRTCEPTEANQTSSRSHAVLQIFVEHKDRSAGVSAEITSAKLSLIDLAGSERAANTNNRGLRLIEGANINRSLLALANCINALSEGSEKGGKMHIPYRDSKLTRLLKDSLGGNSRTVMIACISPFSGSFDDTSNTLKYANRAKNIKTRIERNVHNVSFHINKYNEVISQLQEEIVELRAKISVPGHHTARTENVDTFVLDIDKHFQQEAETRKKTSEAALNIEHLGFVEFAVRSKLRAAQQAEPSDPEAIEELEGELSRTMESMGRFEEEREMLVKKAEMLEGMRAVLAKSWAKAGIRDSYLSYLQNLLRYHVLAMQNIELEEKEQVSAFQLKHKNFYIQCLQEQLSLRDTLIDDMEKVQSVKASTKANKAFAELQTVVEMEEVSKRVFPEWYEPAPLVLPPISKIPVSRSTILKSKPLLSVIDSGKRSPSSKKSDSSMSRDPPPPRPRRSSFKINRQVKRLVSQEVLPKYRSPSTNADLMRLAKVRIGKK
jgi:kinesin family protein 18/19